MNSLPPDWKRDRLKDRVRFAYGDSLAAENRNDGSVKVFGSNGVVGVHDRAITKGRTIIIGRKGSFGKVTWSDEPCFPIDTTFFVDSSQTQEELRWLFYALEDLQLDTVNFDSAVPGLSREMAYSLPLAYPPLPEQQRIAPYLDASCAAIDAAVAAKRRQLEILDALVLSTVQHVTTQGLDPSIQAKPSGLDWLPQVPSHWKVQQIKRRCELLRGKFTHRPRNDPAFYDGEFPFVQTGDITAAEKYIRSYSQTLNELGFSVSKMFPRGTLVMSIAANVGDVAILDFEACFPDSMVGLVPNHQTHLDFLYYLMRAMRGILLRAAVLTTQLNLNYVRIGTNFAPFPPKDEQEQIAAFLNAKSAESHATKTILNKQIEALIAYRKSLIHECVTGQRRITEAVSAGSPQTDVRWAVR
ncbi:MAG: hypothetical protein EWM72_03338 [Nitrospira sp.]|nr:MAG: hypothetical protein EWM72_03338 [Nitrospira sp.]